MSEEKLGKKLIKQFEEKICLLEWIIDSVHDFKRKYPTIAKDESTALLVSTQNELERFISYHDSLENVLVAKSGEYPE